jgi:hypothetical protein
MNFEQKKQELKEKAQRLFKEHYNVNPNAYEEYLGDYWASLFDEELEIVKAKENANKLDLGAEGERIMIMTLGTSLEPLTLATHLVAPRQLFVLYSQQIHLDKFIEALTKKGFVNSPVPISIPEKAGAADVFKLLRGKARGR